MNNWFLYVLFLLSSTFLIGQEVYLEIPEVDVQIKPGDVLILPGTKWSFENRVDTYEKDRFEKLARFFNAHEGLKFRFVIHSNHLGYDEYNLNLSKFQAQEVRDYFLNRKLLLNPSQVSFEGLGEGALLFSKDEIENSPSQKIRRMKEKLNDRIEIIVYE